MTAVGFEPTPFRTGALSQRLRPLGQTVLLKRTQISLRRVFAGVAKLGYELMRQRKRLDVSALPILLSAWLLGPVA